MKRTETRTGPGNATSRWLEERLNSGLYRKLQQALANQFKSSWDSSQLDDHIQTFLANLIQRNALQERIQIQRPIYDSQLCLWLRRSATNDIRSMGRNPVCRVLYNARTEVEERGAYYKLAPQTFRLVCHDPHDEDPASTGTIYNPRYATIDTKHWFITDPAARTPEQVLLDRDWARKLRQQLQRVLRHGAAQPSTRIRHLEICDRLLAGQRASEIAEDLKLTTAQVNTIIASLRRRIKRALKNKLLRLE